MYYFIIRKNKLNNARNNNKCKKKKLCTRILPKCRGNMNEGPNMVEKCEKKMAASVQFS